MSDFSGPYNRKILLLDRIADAITSTDDLDKPTGSRENDSLERLATFFEEHGGIPGGGGSVQADWNATSGPSAILNKPTLRELLEEMGATGGEDSFDEIIGASTATPDDIDSMFNG